MMRFFVLLALLVSGQAFAETTGSNAPAAAIGAQPRLLTDRATDAYSVLDFIPDSVCPSAAIRAGACAADLTNAFKAALATKRNIFVPSGTYRLNGGLTLAAGQKLFGDGVVATQIKIDPSFNMTSPAVLTLLDTSAVDEIGIVFDQSTATSRATLVPYPWAIDVRHAPRVRLGHVRINSAWNGVNCAGNCGGLDIGLIEIGAFNKGMIVDGPLDFVHADSIHLWPFGIVPNPGLKAIYSDGATVGIEIGRADGLDVKSIDTFQAKVVFNSNVTAGASQRIGSMQLDGDGATMTFAAGNLQLGHLSSTKGSKIVEPAVVVTGGSVLIGTLRLWGTTLQPMLLVKGGVVNVQGGSLEQYAASQPAALVVGGTLILSNLYLRPGNVSAVRSAPYILQSDAGVLVATGNTAAARGAGGSGDLVTIMVDNAGNRVSGNHFGGWTFGIPAGAHLGSYGPNRVAPFRWTPVVTFATAGDSVFTYTSQLGEYWYDEGGLHFTIRIAGSFAYSNAAGTLQIATPFPSVDPANAIPVDVGIISNIVLSPGYTQVIAILEAGQIRLRQVGSAKPSALVNAPSIPAGKPIELTLRGYVPAI